MGISGLFGKKNIAGLKVAIEVPDEIYAASEMPVKVVLINQKRFMHSFLVRVNVGDSETLLPLIEKAGASTGVITLRFQNRGLQRIDNIYISSVFPFNFFTRFRRLDTSLDIVVLPALRKCSLQSLFTAEKRARGDKTLDKSGFEAEILSIRNYRHGDPQKYIHWKASAKTGELKVKELSSLSHRPLIIDFEDVAGELEDRISCVAYVIAKCYRLNIPVGLRIGGKLFRPADNSADAGESKSGKIAMLKELALYGA